MSTYTVLYHKHCDDGAAAALAAWLALGDTEARYIPCAYGDPLPEIERGSDVYMLDFTAKRAEILALAQIAGRITILDHHATASADLDGLPEVARNTLGACEIRTTFDMGHSGCVLTWLHFHPTAPVPRMLVLIEDRDLWRFSLPGSRTLHYALSRYDDFRAMAPLVRHPDRLDIAIGEGGIIYGYLREQWRSIIARAGYRMLWVGEPVAHLRRAPSAALCPCPPQWFSEVGEAILTREHAPPEIAILYADNERTGQRTYSLRSLPGGPDVARIAAHFGGGGHPSAAGFRTSDTASAFEMLFQRPESAAA